MGASSGVGAVVLVVALAGCGLPRDDTADEPPSPPPTTSTATGPSSSSEPTRAEPIDLGSGGGACGRAPTARSRCRSAGTPTWPRPRLSRSSETGCTPPTSASTPTTSTRATDCGSPASRTRTACSPTVASSWAPRARAAFATSPPTTRRSWSTPSKAPWWSDAASADGALPGSGPIRPRCSTTTGSPRSRAVPSWLARTVGCCGASRSRSPLWYDHLPAQETPHGFAMVLGTGTLLVLDVE